ncbi:hypothetical protein FEM48_Zijuj07G0132000 [Ziziphus jujuba var. spinosa]|uniref:Peptidase A1 domain-containing protein n=1 Tax=Ziziphus jujuba var. spinosa TaxID=714518 RepID=A0A978V4U5_ZIZJJ|nr:hypothetical protein FEM48_Zijuj07G0132000 [Ziziphus jujuba var. spinosa]
MAGLLLQFLLLVPVFLCVQAQSSYNLADSLLLPVTKHGASLQYLTKIHHGNGLVPTELVLDLGGPFLWMDSVSSSGSLISSGSIQCLAAKSMFGDDDHGRSKSFLEICKIFPENRITQMGNQGELVNDTFFIQSKSSGSVTSVSQSFLFGSAPISLLNGLATGAQGMLGLGRHRISLPSQISAAFDSKWQFSLCLSSSNGILVFENRLSKSYFGPELSHSLIYTPLLKTQLADTSNHEYFINLQSIRINGKTLSLEKGLGGSKLSTIVPYTTMESSIFAVFSKAYEKAAMAMNMKKVKSVAPFGLCFSSEGIQETLLGPEVPAIDLVLQSKMVKWRIYGRNSMVMVSNEIMCLGFLDGGSDLKSSITLGGYQLEDILLHLDVGASMLGFSPSLLLKQRSCSDFELVTMSKESL